MILLNSCSFFNQDKIDVEIENNSNFAIVNLKFSTSNDQVKIDTLDKNEKIKKTLDFDNLDSENPTDGWSISFSNINGKVVEISCTDILIDKKRRNLKIVVLNDKLDTEYSGECF